MINPFLIPYQQGPDVNVRNGGQSCYFSQDKRVRNLASDFIDEISGYWIFVPTRNWKNQEDKSLTFYRKQANYLIMEQPAKVTGSVRNL